MNRLHRRSSAPFMATALLFAAVCAAPVAWSTVPDDKTAADTISLVPVVHEHQHHRGPKQFVIANAGTARLRLWKPDLSVLPLVAEDGRITLPSTGMDNYHALVAEDDRGQLRQALIRYEYLRGKPSGHSPTALTAARKTDFEIVPDPIPREHNRYHSGEEWAFLLRFRDKPVAGLPVILETANGGSVKGVSDSHGRVELLIPDDFPNVREGERDRRSAELTLSAEYTEAGVAYQTLLTAEYRVNPSHWQSFELGVTVAGLGFLAGGVLGRVGKPDSGVARRKAKRVRS